MVRTIRVEAGTATDLTHFWGQYFQEIPVCSHPGCGGVAVEVDDHFPYIDDFNRCEHHPLPSFEHGRREARCERENEENGRAAMIHSHRWRKPTR